MENFAYRRVLPVLEIASSTPSWPTRGSSATTRGTPWRAGSIEPSQYGWQMCRTTADREVWPNITSTYSTNNLCTQGTDIGYSSSSGGTSATIPPAPPAGRRGRSRTPTLGQTRDPASYISDADFAAMREGRPFEPSAAAAQTAGHDGYPGPVTRRAPRACRQSGQGGSHRATRCGGTKGTSSAEDGICFGTSASAAAKVDAEAIQWHRCAEGPIKGSAGCQPTADAGETGSS